MKEETAKLAVSEHMLRTGCFSQPEIFFIQQCTCTVPCLQAAVKTLGWRELPL